jgi:opacity protein-like surface antigen
MATTNPVKSGICRAQLRQLFLAGTSLIALTGSALAADLPVAKAPPPAVIASWAGFYLGAHGGYGWKRDDFSELSNFFVTEPLPINGIRSKGAVYGAQAGYNWQFGPVVTGLEIDFSVTDIKGSNGVSQSLVIPGEGSASSSETLGENVKYLGSARARLGWLPAGNVLLYGTAGLAWERLDRTQDSSQVFTPIEPSGGGSQFSSTRSPTDKFGWVAGVGAEMMLGSPNWIGRVEYLHYDFRSPPPPVSRRRCREALPRSAPPDRRPSMSFVPAFPTSSASQQGLRACHMRRRRSQRHSRRGRASISAPMAAMAGLTIQPRSRWRCSAGLARSTAPNRTAGSPAGTLVATGNMIVS